MKKAEIRQVSATVNPKQYNFLLNTTKRKNHEYGSAGSGKSWSFAQFFIFEKMLKEHDIRFIITRKTGPALSKSAWLLMQDLLHHYDVPFDKNTTDRLLTVGSNEMYFVPLDDPNKLKSFEKINYIWAEEATELFKADYIQLGLRCRGHNPNGPNALYFSYNPVLLPHNKYLKDITVNPPKDTAVLHTTYKDNAFLEQDYIDEIEGLEGQDGTYWQIYGLGLWATLKNLIYTNWDVIPAEQWLGLTHMIRNIGYGLDFGFNEPTALVELSVKEDHVFERELLYERKLTNTELIERLKQLIPDRRRIIVADCAQPERIQEILQAGFNIWPCSKGPSSIKIGIDRVKRFQVHVHGDSTNLIEEKETYKWKEDLAGDPLDVPVDYKNHLLDGERYYLGEVKFDAVSEFVVIGNYMR